MLQHITKFWEVFLVHEDLATDFTIVRESRYYSTGNLPME